MSHYSVLVLRYEDGASVDEMLAPYDENLKVDQYIGKTKPELIEEARHSGAMCYDEATEKWYKISDKCVTDDDYYAAYRSYLEEYYDSEFDSEGNLLSTYNPKSKWDWYTICGRFEYDLKLRDDYDTDDNVEVFYEESIPLKYLDFSSDHKEYDEALKYWNEHTASDEEDSYWSYVRSQYNCAEDYAEILSTPSTWAVITPDGEWHEPGQVGWFGMSSATQDQETEWFKNYKRDYIDPYDPETTFACLVDCHI